MLVQVEICDSRHSFNVFSVHNIIVLSRCYLVILGAAAAEVCCQCGESEEETGGRHSSNEAQGLLVQVGIGPEAGILQPRCNTVTAHERHDLVSGEVGR